MHDKRSSRQGGEVVRNVKQTYDLIEDSFDAYLDSLTVDALLNCAQDAEHAESYLADRLENESLRLAAR